MLVILDTFKQYVYSKFTARSFIVTGFQRVFSPQDDGKIILLDTWIGGREEQETTLQKNCFTLQNCGYSLIISVF